MPAGKIKCEIREDSFIAKIAAWKLGSGKVAIVIGRTIHLHNTTKDEFLKNVHWVRHELAHVRQFQQFGYLKFIFKYFVESIKHGYRNNKYEEQARKEETNEQITQDFTIL